MRARTRTSAQTSLSANKRNQSRTRFGIQVQLTSFTKNCRNLRTMLSAKLSGALRLFGYATIVQVALAASGEQTPAELCKDLQTGFYLLKQTLVNTAN